MQLQGVRPCGHCLYVSKNHVPSVKTRTQIDLNRTRLKEFTNLNIYINIKKKKKSWLKKNPIFFLFKKKFLNPENTLVQKKGRRNRDMIMCLIS